MFISQLTLRNLASPSHLWITYSSISMVTALWVVILIYRLWLGQQEPCVFWSNLASPLFQSPASLPYMPHLGHAPDGSVPSRTKIFLAFQLTDQLSDQWLCHLYVCYRSMALALGPS